MLLPLINSSASRDSNGVVHLSLVNIDPNNTVSIKLGLSNATGNNVTGQILTSAKVTDINTFEIPNAVRLEKFSAVKKDEGSFVVEMPAKSVVVLEN